MDIALHGSTVTLERDRMIAVRDAAGSTVRCLRGSLWITERRGESDVILGAGESFTITRGGLTVITALDDATMRVCERARSTAPRLLAQLRAWFSRQRRSMAA